MKDQVLSIEQMEELQKLGLDTSEASMFYKRGIWTGVDYQYQIFPLCNKDVFLPRTGDIRTFILQDILELLPMFIANPLTKLSITKYHKWDFRYENTLDECEPIIVVQNNNILQAAYKILVWITMNNYLKQ